MRPHPSESSEGSGIHSHCLLQNLEESVWFNQERGQVHKAIAARLVD